MDSPAMDSETLAALQADLDLILAHRIHRMGIRGSSVEEEEPLPGGSEQPPQPFPTLALAPDSVPQKVRCEAEAAITATQEQHNAGLPVNNLPPELLTSILQLALKDADSPRCFLANILLVCRTWNWVVLDSPTLWTRWNSWDGPNELQYLKCAVIRSRSLGLTLSCNLRNQEPGGLLWGELGRCMSRWQDASFDIGYQSCRLFAVLPKLGNNTAPKLRKLYLGSTHSYMPLDILDPHDPCPLETLELCRTSVVWSAVNFGRLRYLHVSGKCEMAPSVPELLQIFERSPRLEYLCLRDIKLSPESTTLSMPSEPVCLPHLSYCEISCMYTADTLIHMIRFPSCKEVAICETRITGPDSISSLAHVAHVIESEIKVTDTTLSLYGDEFSVFTVGRGNSQFNTAGRRISQLSTRGEPEAVLRWFINMARAALNASPTVKFSLESNFSYDRTMRVIAELGDINNITDLRLLGGLPSRSRCNPLDCIDNLGDQIQRAFPRLRAVCFCINTMSELESLRRVVLRRHQAIASQQRADISPLQSVSIARDNDWDLEDHCKDQLDEIQGLIAGGNLFIGFQRWGASR